MSLRGHVNVARGSLAVAVLLAIGIMFMATGTTLAISGMSASSEPAVQAQYPDAEALAPPEQGIDPPVVSSLADIGREMREDPMQRVETERLRPRVVSLLTDAATMTDVDEAVREYGAIPLLLSGVVVFAIGGVLRFRRRPRPLAL